MTAAYLAAIAILIGLGWLYWLAVTAPLGWEDEDGFHEGTPDE